MFISTFLVVTS